MNNWKPFKEAEPINAEQLKADIEHAERTARLERKYNEVYITVPKWVFDRMKQELDQEGGEDE